MIEQLESLCGGCKLYSLCETAYYDDISMYEQVHEDQRKALFNELHKIMKEGERYEIRYESFADYRVRKKRFIMKSYLTIKEIKDDM